MMNSDTTYRAERVLTCEGICFRGRRWNSPALDALRRRLGPVARVLVRIDPTDPTHAYVQDEERRVCIRGELVAGDGRPFHANPPSSDRARESGDAGREELVRALGLGAVGDASRRRAWIARDRLRHDGLTSPNAPDVG